MTKVLVVDDMNIFRDAVAAALRGRGYEVAVAANGSEAVSAIRAQAFDLVLLDIAMPVMDGLSTLKKLREDGTAIPRVILLTAVAEKGYVVEAAKLGVRDYLLKSTFSLDDLYGRIEKILGADAAPAPIAAAVAVVPAAVPAAAPADPLPVGVEGGSLRIVADPADHLKSMTPVMKRSEILEMLDAAGELQAFSPAVTKVLKLTRTESCSVEAVGKAIRQDQATALKILRIANSSVYSRGEPVESVERAVTRIGMEKIRQVLLNLAVVDQFSGEGLESVLDAGLFWEHSIGCGLIASEIARAVADDEAADTAFTMGLVHDIGRLIFGIQLGATYRDVVEESKRVGLPLEQVESRRLLMNHADGMDRLLHAWHFPKNLIDPIVHHHLSMGNIRRMAPRRVPEVATLALADRLCHALVIGDSGNDFIYPTGEFCTALELDPKVMTFIEEKLRDEATNLKLAMLTESAGASSWKDRRDAMLDQIGAPMRPIFASESPQYDAYRIFLEQLRSTDEGEANIAVAHFSSNKHRAAVAVALRKAEKEAGGVRPPLMILSSLRDLKLERDLTADRFVRQIPTPTPVPLLLRTLGECLAAGGEARAAA